MEQQVSAKLKKYKFCLEHAVFLGYVVLKEGNKVNP